MGHDKSTGNNLTPKSNSSAMSMMGHHPDFQSLDTKNHGYVMAPEVKDAWLKDNFAKCDADKDGRLTKQEYAVCAMQ